MIYSIEHLSKLVEERIGSEKFGEDPSRLYEPLRYIMQLKGKRVRPLMVLMAYGLYEENIQKVLDQAISVEVFHNFTLIHDDIMDNAPIRRGQSTVHEKWNTNIGILSGDVMLVKVYEMLMRNYSGEELKAILELFSQTATRVCEGQQYDMDFETELSVSVESYLKMIRYKTSELLAYSLALGALLAGKSEEAKVLYDAGIKAGIGFQLKDDLLDVYGDDSFGKQIGGDIIANKKTYLTILTMEKASEDDRKELLSLYSDHSATPEAKIKRVKQLYEKYGVQQKAEELIEKNFDEAFQLLKKLEAPLNRKKTLRQFLELLINRTT